MKLRLVTVIAALTLAIPMVCSAAPAKPGPYFSGFLGTSFARNATVSTFSGATTYTDQVEFDPGVYLGGTGGYDFGFLRLEGELSYRHANIDTITQTEPAPAVRYRNVDGNLGVFATMFNMFLDMHNDSRVTPYIGGGIGFASLYLSNTDGYDGVTYQPLYNESNDTVFAYQAGGGLDVALNNRFSLDIGYRYFITEKAKFDSVTPRASEFNFESHNASIGFKFKF